jgi:hypothetical protein
VEARGRLDEYRVLGGLGRHGPSGSGGAERM